MAAGAVKRADELAPQPFPQRVFDDECFELADELRTLPELEFVVDAVFDRAGVQFVEPHPLGPSEFGIREVGECRPAPARERVAEHARRVRRIVGRCARTPLGDERLERVRVDNRAAEVEAIARAGERHSIANRPTELRHVRLQRVRGGWRRLVTPQRFGELVDADCFVGVHEEHREHGARAPARERHGGALGVDDREGPEDPKLQLRLRPRRGGLHARTLTPACTLAPGGENGSHHVEVVGELVEVFAREGRGPGSVSHGDRSSDAGDAGAPFGVRSRSWGEDAPTR